MNNCDAIHDFYFSLGLVLGSLHSTKVLNHLKTKEVPQEQISKAIDALKALGKSAYYDVKKDE